MKFGEKVGEKIEKFYLEILRWLLLIAATVSLLVFIALSFFFMVIVT